MPRLGDTADDVVVLEWLAAVGDSLNRDDPLVRVETSKVDTDVHVPVAGRLVEHLVKPGDEVTVGAPIAVMESD